MPIFKVNCHNCWEQPIVVHDKAPVFCSQCGEEMRQHIENIEINEDESYTDLIEQLLHK